MPSRSLTWIQRREKEMDSYRALIVKRWRGRIFRCQEFSRWQQEQDVKDHPLFWRTFEIMKKRGIIRRISGHRGSTVYEFQWDAVYREPD